MNELVEGRRLSKSKSNQANSKIKVSDSALRLEELSDKGFIGTAARRNDLSTNQ